MDIEQEHALWVTGTSYEPPIQSYIAWLERSLWGEDEKP